METVLAITLVALVQFGLGVSSMVLTSVATRCEGSITEPTLEWTLASMHSFVHLEVRLVEEFFSTCPLNTYIIFKDKLKITMTIENGLGKNFLLRIHQKDKITNDICKKIYNISKGISFGNHKNKTVSLLTSFIVNECALEFATVKKICVN